MSGSESDSDTDCEEAGDAKPTPKGPNTDTINSINHSDTKSMSKGPNTDTTHSVSSEGEFSTPLAPDEVEVNYDGEAMTIQWGSGIEGL